VGTNLQAYGQEEPSSTISIEKQGTCAKTYLLALDPGTDKTWNSPYLA
jgi:hypothetical protein